MPTAAAKNSAHGVQKQTHVNSTDWKDILETQNHTIESSDLNLNQISNIETPTEAHKSPPGLHHTPHIFNPKQDASSPEKEKADTTPTTVGYSTPDNKKSDQKQAHLENTEQGQSLAFFYISPSHSTENISRTTEHNENEKTIVDGKNKSTNSVYFPKNSSIYQDNGYIDNINSIPENQKNQKTDIKISSKENFSEHKQDKTAAFDEASTPKRNNIIQKNAEYKANESFNVPSTAYTEPKKSQKNISQNQNNFKISKTITQKIDSNIFIQSKSIEKDVQLSLKKIDINKDKNLQINTVAGLKENFNTSPSEIDSKSNISVSVDKTSLATSALSAAVIALHKSSQNSILLRLDPPNLGHLSIQIKMNPEGSVNVSFIPSSSDAAQTLLASLPQLNVALVQSGLSLGEAEIGGQFSQSGRQQNQQNMNTSIRKIENNISDDTAPSVSYSKGLSFYA